MAEKDQDQSTELEVLNTENKELKQEVIKGQKYIMYGMIAISVIAILVLIYIFAIRNPGIKAANEAVAQADITLAAGNDSLALEQYRQVADQYGYAAGNRAALMAASMLYQKKEYQQALDELKNFSPSEAIVGAAAKSLEGDCYVNLEQYDKALSCYDKAVSISDDNQYYTPLFLVKKATVLRHLQRYADELKTLETIKNDFPTYVSTYRMDINKYIARARYQAEQAK